MNTPNRRDFVRAFATTTSGAGLALAALAPSRAPAQSAPGSAPVPGVFNVRDFGAKGDGVTKDTAAIQAAIDAGTRAGGGLVVFPAGRFLSGTIVLKDHVTLHLSPSAVLLGSPEAADYVAKPFPARDLDVGGFEIWALVYADGAQHIGIEGTGTIDGNGKPFPPLKATPDVAGSVRPRAVFWKNCRQVRVRDVTILESAMWSVHLALCERAWLENLTIVSSHFYNQDGIILDSCRDAFIDRCFVNTFDDAIVIKTSFPQPCVNIAIANCVLTSRCAAIKFGTQSLGEFRNVSISNCALYDCGLGGIKFLTVDGGDLQDVVVSNITMTNVSAPLFFRIGNRGQDFGFKDVIRPRPVARLRNVVVSGVRAVVSSLERFPGRKETMRTGATMGIAGLIGHPVEDIVLENIHVTYPGGGTLEEARRTNIPEREANYPENTTFGVLPAYGMFIRHAKGITLRNVHLELEKPDLRPALICDDVEGLDVNGLEARLHGSEPLMRLRQTRGALIRHSRPLGAIETFASIEGAQSADIALQANDLRRVRRATVKDEGVAAEVVMEGNLVARITR
jgi:hypothetical protein